MSTAVRIDADTFVERVDAHMLDLLSERSGAVVDAATRQVEAGGKRMRPLLVRATSMGAHEDCAIRAAAAVELIHTASLIHDDMLDDASVRRGVATIEASHGTDVAIAAGDLLFSLAFDTLVRCRADCQDERVLAAVRLLAGASRTLAEGEALQALQLRDPYLETDAYLRRCAAKTGVLFGVSLQLGAVLGGAGAGDVTLLGEFGTDVGVAFQIADDLLDCGTPDTAELLGKQPGADLRDGTITLPMIIAVARDASLADVLAAPVEDVLVETVLARIRASGAIDDARRFALDMVDHASAMLDRLDHRFDREPLQAMALAAVHRIM